MTTKKRTVKTTPKNLAIAAPTVTSYDKDFFKWTRSQVSLLKKGQIDKIDVANLIEEIESLGKSDKRSLNSHLINLLMHMLKKKYQKMDDTSSWDTSITNARIEIKLLLRDSPSLRNELIKVFGDAYQDAREKAAVETRLNINKFPVECPWELEDVLQFELKPSKKQK